MSRKNKEFKNSTKEKKLQASAPGPEVRLKAIQYLIDHGARFDEWSEAGLLHEIVDIVSCRDIDLSPESLAKMIERAKNN